MKKENLEIRSQEVQELLGHVPRWIIRWGTIIVFLILVALFILSKTLSYPDIINSQIFLTTNIPPAELKANIDGTITKILVGDQQLVKKGQVLAVIQSGADYDDVSTIEKYIADSFSIENFLTHKIVKQKLELGEIQPDFAAFLNTLDEYKNFVDVDYYARKLKSIEKELTKYKQYEVSLKEQHSILIREYQLVIQQYRRDSGLTDKGVLSATDLEVSEQNKLKKLFELKESVAKLNQATIQITNLEQEKLELQLQLEKEDTKIFSDLKARWNELLGAISQWKDNYLIISPFDGRISMNKIWSANQYVKTGEIVMIVLPLKSDKIIGRVSIQPSGAGKVHEGNKVIIQFDNYPYLEYGVVTGKIISLSLVPENGTYYAKVAIDSSTLITNYSNHLAFSQNMQGNAEIITQSRTLFDRIFAPFKSTIEIQNMYKKED